MMKSIRWENFSWRIKPYYARPLRKTREQLALEYYVYGPRVKRFELRRFVAAGDMKRLGEPGGWHSHWVHTTALIPLEEERRL